VTEYYGGWLEGYGGSTPTPPTPSGPLAWPELIVEVDFVNDANPSTDVMPQAVWTDISEHVRVGGFSLRRGRARSLDRNEAGTITMLLNNRDRRFDAAYEAGPYYPNVLPNRRIRVQTLVETGTTAFHVGDSFVGGDYVLDGGIILLGLFYGYTDAWQQDYPGKGLDATVTVTATDMFGLFSQDLLTFDQTTADLQTGFYAVLNQRAYTGKAATVRDPITNQPLPLPSPAWDIAPSQRQIRSGWYTNAGMLEALQQLANSDGGNFFISREGRITYLAPEVRTSRVDVIPTYGPGGEDVSDIARVYDDTLIFNHVTVNLVELGGSAIAQDATSIERYGLHPVEITTQLADTTEATARAAEILSQYRYPTNYIRELTMSNTTSDWQQALETDLWDMVLVEVPLPNGDTYSQLSLVEGIAISSSWKNDWSITWQLSLADPFPNLLTDEQESFEGGTTTGWTAETNCTIDVSTYAHYEGDYSLQVAASIAADMSVLAAGAPVEALAEYSAEAFCWAPMGGLFTGSPVHIEVDWLDGISALISTSTGTTKSVRPRQWTPVGVTATAPAGAVSAQVRIVFEDALAPTAIKGSIQYDMQCSYADAISLRRTL